MPLMAIRLSCNDDLSRRIEKYRCKQKHPSTDSAVQALIRLGLFYQAAPTGSVIIRRDANLIDYEADLNGTVEF